MKSCSGDCWRRERRKKTPPPTPPRARGLFHKSAASWSPVGNALRGVPLRTGTPRRAFPTGLAKVLQNGHLAMSPAGLDKRASSQPGRRDGEGSKNDFLPQRVIAQEHHKENTPMKHIPRGACLALMLAPWPSRPGPPTGTRPVPTTTRRPGLHRPVQRQGPDRLAGPRHR